MKSIGAHLLILLVGAAGFEPATPCAQGRCATRLRYAPTTLFPLFILSNAGLARPALAAAGSFGDDFPVIA